MTITAAEAAELRANTSHRGTREMCDTIIELYDHRDRLAEDLTLANSVIAELEAERSALCATATAGILACEKLAVLQAAIGKVLADHVSDGMPNPWCQHDGFSWPCWTVQALTQGGEGS